MGAQPLRHSETCKYRGDWARINGLLRITSQLPDCRPSAHRLWSLWL